MLCTGVSLASNMVISKLRHATQNKGFLSIKQYWLVVSAPLKHINQWEGYPYNMENKTCLKPPAGYEFRM